jgi:hypothetical protein
MVPKPRGCRRRARSGVGVANSTAARSEHDAALRPVPSERLRERCRTSARRTPCPRVLSVGPDPHRWHRVRHRSREWIGRPAGRCHPQPGRRVDLLGRLCRLPSLARGASASHPYGYERDEDPAGLGVGLVIWASAVFDGYVRTHKLASRRSTSHLWLGVAAAAVGVLPAQALHTFKLDHLFRDR